MSDTQHRPISLSRIAHEAASTSYTPRQVAKAYGYPLEHTGAGQTIALIELGGGYSDSDLSAYFHEIGINPPTVESVPVDGGQNKSDGPNGADGEVLLDIEVAGAVAPGATIKVYFAPNTDSGFLAAIEQAISDEVTVISISWGSAERNWSSQATKAFNEAFQKAREAGIVVFAAAGDTGSADSASGNNVDFPASSPHVIGCGGTRLNIDANGQRTGETVWNDDPSRSATGGGISVVYPGRQVPDVAGCADPQTGYRVRVDGQDFVIGGTSAVAPLYAGLTALLSEAIGKPLGKQVDLMNTLLTNLGVCFDVTSGDNGAYRAGPGRDETTGLGVVDGGKLLAVLTDSTADPAPFPGTGTGPAPTPAPEPQPTPQPTPAPAGDTAAALAEALRRFLDHHEYPHYLREPAEAWLAEQG